MFIVLFRTAILYVLVVLSMRLMGKRQIGELEPFEIVVAIMIADLAALPMQDTRIPLLHGIIPIVTLLLLQIIISILQLKSHKIQEIIDGKPTVLIKNGQLQISQLRNQRFSVSEIMEELRINGYLNIEDIHYATLETNGQISVIPKTELEPASKKDMNIKVTQQTMPVILVTEGKINYKNLVLVHKSESWLLNELKKSNVKSVEDIFVAILDSNNKLFFQLKDNIHNK